MPSARQRKGAKGEDLAAQWLKDQGFVILQRNYRFGKGELDIIAMDPASVGSRFAELVFVEVKWRRNASFSPPEAAVTHHKRRLLWVTAESFLRQHRLENTSCRFDIIAMTGEGSRLQIEHIEDAFSR